MESTHLSEIQPAYTVRDLMRLTGMGNQKVRRMMREGSLPGIVDGRTYTCPRALYDAWVQRQAQTRPHHDTRPVTLLHRIDRRSA